MVLKIDGSSPGKSAANHNAKNREKKIADFCDYAWKRDLLFNKDGNLQKTVGNVAKILRHSNEWSAALAQNVREFNSPFLVRRPPFVKDRTDRYPRQVSNSDIIKICEWFEDNFGIGCGPNMVLDALVSVSSIKKLDQVFDYFESLEWDNISRIDQWLIDCSGVKDTAYTRGISRYFLLSAVARTYIPGSKVDTMLILEGNQGLRKSTLLRVLAGDDWFLDNIGDIKHKDTFMQLNTPLIIEIAELDAFTKKETSSIKQFLGIQVDRYRPPYGRLVEAFPRRCVFAGTTNKTEYLKDETGGRRFWPVKVGDFIDVELIAQNRDQLWAEAVHRFKKGELWYFNSDDKGAIEAKEEQELRRESDPWEAIIRKYLDENIYKIDYDASFDRDTRKRKFITTHELLIEAINKPPDRQERRDQMRVGNIMTSTLGWTRGRIRLRKGSESREYVYYPPEDYNFATEETQLGLKY